MADTKAIALKADITAGQILDNFDAIRADLIVKVQPYQGLVFSDDNIKEAKETSAYLAKMETAIEDKRKSIKKQWNEPYMLFEQKAKELVAVITGAKDPIKRQIDDYNERKRQEKREQVEAQMETQLSALDASEQAYIRQVGIAYDPRWENATVAMSQVQKDIAGQIEQIQKDVSSLNELCGADNDLLTALLDEYQRTKDMPAVFAKQKSILARREAIKQMAEAKAEEERKRVEEAERQRIAEAGRKCATELNAIAKDLGDEDTIPLPVGEPAPAPQHIIVRFEVTGTLDDIKSVIAFMNERGIQSHRIK